MHYHLNDIMPRTSITISMVWHPRQFLEQRQAATTLDWATSGALALGNISYILWVIIHSNTVGNFLVGQPSTDIEDSQYQ